MRKKIAIYILALLTFCLSLFGLMACKNGETSGDSSSEAKALTLNHKTLVLEVGAQETLVAYYGEDVCSAEWVSLDPMIA